MRGQTTHSTEDKTMRHTYKDRVMADLITRGFTHTVCLPDAVAQDMRAWDGRTFLALGPWRTRVRVRLDGGAFDLGGSGTGDPVVRLA